MRSGVQFVETEPVRPASARSPVEALLQLVAGERAATEEERVGGGDRDRGDALERRLLGRPGGEDAEARSGRVDGLGGRLHETRGARGPARREHSRDVLITVGGHGRRTVAPRPPAPEPRHAGPSSARHEAQKHCEPSSRACSESGSSARVSVYDGSHAG